MKLTIIGFLMLSLFSTKPLYGQSKEISVEAFLEYEEFATSTIEDVPCEFFKAAFAETIRRVEITDSVDLKMIVKYLEKFKKAKPKPIDVRVLFTNRKNGEKQEYCMDRWGLFVNKKTGGYYTNKLLAHYILKRSE